MSADLKCWCEKCRPIDFFNDPESVRMILCPVCGNKRCPHANNHLNACTGSNEPGQLGSSWEHVPPVSGPTAASGPVRIATAPRRTGKQTAIDRELLELAAKAAGWTVVRWTDDDTALLLQGIEEPFNSLHENPHSDCMGDALRLARALHMTIAHEPSRGGWSVGAIVNGEFKWLAHDDDQRRAIVRAAAKIGRTMP